MGSEIDETMQQQIDEFHRRLDRMAAFYQQAAVGVAAVRLMKDLNMAREPGRFGLHFVERGQVLRRAARGIWQRFYSAKGDPIHLPIGPGAKKVVVIDEQGERVEEI
jgi:hypothetical protein